MKNTDPQVMLVMEFIELGSLVNYLKLHRVQVTAAPSQPGTGKPAAPLPLLKYAADICSGMHYLEYKQVLHRDLAARNILVASDRLVKISDFGLARSLDANEQFYRIRNPARNLPIKWYAPESLRTLEFTHKSDVWSYGITLWEMYSYGDDPAYPVGESEAQLLGQLLALLEQGVRLPCPPDCPHTIYQIMSNCWKNSAADRPTFSTLQTHVDMLLKESGSPF